MQPTIRNIEYPKQSVSSQEATNIAAQDEWHKNVATPNHSVTSDAKKAKVETKKTEPTP